MAVKTGQRLRVGTPDESPEDVVARVSKALAEKFPLESVAAALTGFSEQEKAIWLSSFTEAEKIALEHSWEFWARPDQRTPKGKWKNWVLCCGRAWGKTRTASEWVRQKITSGQCKHIALVGPTANDVRKVMVEDIRTFGSGIMQVFPTHDLPEYYPTRRMLYWPKYNASCSLYSGEDPEMLRGPQHDGAWVDEIMRMKQQDMVWDMLQMGLRGAVNAQAIVTTTPKSTDLMRRLVKMPNTFVTYGKTFDNNVLPADYLQMLTREYKGTRQGEQELFGAILDDIQGALWTREVINSNRLEQDSETSLYKVPTLRRTVIGVDPQTGKNPDEKGSSERKTLTGIVVAGVSEGARGYIPHAYVLEDASINGYPAEWGKQIVKKYHQYNASLVVCEGNQGGKMIPYIINSIDSSVRIRVVTATTKKHERAQPVVNRYEQGQVHHVGVFGDLEHEMLSYEPGDEDKKRSPDRMDALVWAIRELLITRTRAGAGFAIKRII